MIKRIGLKFGETNVVADVNEDGHAPDYIGELIDRAFKKLHDQEVSQILFYDPDAEDA